VPDGHLRVNEAKGYMQYYQVHSDNSHSAEYIPSNKLELAKELAQKSYDKKILRYCERTLSDITRLLKNYEDDKIEKIYLEEHTKKQPLIIPVETTLSESLKEWKNIPYTGKEFNEGQAIITTNSGIRVRSKSEKIMADYFDSLGISYKYECPVRLKSFGIVYPDFTFLNLKTGREIYWEHEGMMDNPEYARNAVQKINLYEFNGIFPGENLILTFETSTTVISTELLASLTEKYLLPHCCVKNKKDITDKQSKQRKR